VQLQERYFHSSCTMSTEPTGTPIETLFQPTNRLRELRLELGGDPGLDALPEVELLPHLSWQDILGTGVPWADFVSFLGGGMQVKVVWMTLNAYVSLGPQSLHTWRCFLSIGNETGERVNVIARKDTDDAVVTDICDCVLCLLGTCEESHVNVSGIYSGFVSCPLHISGPCLSRFFEERRNNLTSFTFENVILGQEHMRALATVSLPTRELILCECSLSDDTGSRDAFVECLQRDRGPTELIRCVLGFRILADALSGNSRVVRLEARCDVSVLEATGEWAVEGPDNVMFFRAVANMRGLVELDLASQCISSDSLAILCESLQVHSTLTILNLKNTVPRSSTGGRTGGRAQLSNEQKRDRARMLAKLLQTNTVLHTIRTWYGEFDDQICTESIQPCLETNLYKPRVLAVKKTNERPFREKVLGRALSRVRSKPNLVWMFLSQNVDAFVRSEEEGNSEVAVPVAVVAAVPVPVVAGNKRKR
jgi:hypothetical protein